MIAIAKPSTPIANKGSSQLSNHQQFLSFLPSIRRHAKLSFRHLDFEAREESVAETIAQAWSAFRRLAELDRLSLAYPSALARFGVARVRDGRGLGCRTSVRDVLSPRCQHRKHIRVESLDHAEEHDGWREVLVEDHRVGPAQTAVVRLDFASWLSTLSQRDRQIAEVLAGGESGLLAARRFGVAPSRISQLRRKLHQLWLAFQGELAATQPAAVSG
jgi:hypothetical protein